MRTKTLKSLQSYILSTTTETRGYRDFAACCIASIVHPFNNNWNELLSRKHCAGLASIVHPFNNNWNWILCVDLWSIRLGFNRTSFQQQLKPKSSISTKILSKLQSYILSTTTETDVCCLNVMTVSASIVHPFNNNWNVVPTISGQFVVGFNRTSFQQQLKLAVFVKVCQVAVLQSYILSTTTETFNQWRCRFQRRFNRTSFQQQLKLYSGDKNFYDWKLQSYILSTTTET